MEKMQKLEYQASIIASFEVQFEGNLMRQSHQHDDESEWES